MSTVFQKRSTPSTQMKNLEKEPCMFTVLGPDVYILTYESGVCFLSFYHSIRFTPSAYDERFEVNRHLTVRFVSPQYISLENTMIPTLKL